MHQSTTTHQTASRCSGRITHPTQAEHQPCASRNINGSLPFRTMRSVLGLADNHRRSDDRCE